MRTILESVQDVKNLEYAELKSKLKLCFEEGAWSQDYCSQFTYRKERYGEECGESALGSELKKFALLTQNRLTRRATRLFARNLLIRFPIIS